MKKILFSFIFLIPCSCNALTVRTVYRADIRPPDQVFNNGFTAWGINVNYMSHILGLSGAAGSRDSAFIPTTSNHDIAMNFGRERAVSTGQPYYVYNIRATDNMYPALETTYHIYDSSHVRVSEDVRSTISREQEYSAYSHISPQQIRSVEIIKFVNGQWITETQNNSNYMYNNTNSHDGPFENSISHPLNHTARFLVGASNIGEEFLPQEDYDNYHSPIYFFSCLSQ